MFSKLFFSFCSPWCFSSKHFIINDSKCPNITFETVFIIIEGFRWHINRTANIVGGVSFRVSIFHGKAKISNFNLMMGHKYIRRLEITVYDSVFCYLIVPIDHLPHHLHRLAFRNSFPLTDKLGQIALITKFCNDVSVIFGSINIEELQNIG